MIIVTCPQCGADLEFKEVRDFAFCEYCGTKITNISEAAELNKVAEINNLILRVLDFEQKGDYTKCEECINLVLELDPTNQMAMALKQRMPKNTSGHNVTIKYKSVHDYKYKLRISLDGRNWKVMNKDEDLELTLPVGKYQIIFSGTRSYTYNLVIIDTTQRITLVYDAQPRKNVIEEVYQ